MHDPSPFWLKAHRLWQGCTWKMSQFIHEITTIQPAAEATEEAARARAEAAEATEKEARTTGLSEDDESERLQDAWKWWDKLIWLAGCADSRQLKDWVAQPNDFVSQRRKTAITFSDPMVLWPNPTAEQLLGPGHKAAVSYTVCLVARQAVLNWFSENEKPTGPEGDDNDIMILISMMLMLMIKIRNCRQSLTPYTGFLYNTPPLPEHYITGNPPCNTGYHADRFLVFRMIKP